LTVEETLDQTQPLVQLPQLGVAVVVVILLALVDQAGRVAVQDTALLLVVAVEQELHLPCKDLTVVILMEAEMDLAEEAAQGNQAVMLLVVLPVVLVAQD
jgi:hypothetical protein